MSFLVQRVAGRTLSLSEIRRDTLRIGRGTSPELRSDNPAVALEHAAIEGGPEGYTIRDNGSVTGTYVNGKPVESQRLAKGDVIEIGDLRITVQAADAGKPCLLRVNSTGPRAGAAVAAYEEPEESPGAAAVPGAGAIKAPKTDFVSAYSLRRPYLSKVTFVGLLLVVALGVIGKSTLPENRKAFMPGGVSSAHARARDARGKPISENCNACHDPWHYVVDSRCSECHGTAGHAQNVASLPPCASCHAEHRAAPSLASISDTKCVACHADLPPRMKNRDAVALASFASVTSFGGKHPDFTWPADGDTLRLNHALHLKKGGIFNGNGVREQLTCSSCHKLVETRGKFDPAPIQYATHCQRCHRLTFDPRFPQAEVPHGGDPGIAYGFILTTFAGNRDLTEKPPDEIRRILTSKTLETPDERAVIAAEQVVKVKCSLCHQLTRVNGRLAATRPVIPARWMGHANFSHSAHRNVDCESCHGAARTSSRTSDVLMPSRKECTPCHGGAPQVFTAALIGGGGGRASSRCILCHDYHLRKELMTRVPPAALAKSGGTLRASLGSGGGMYTTILLLAIAILLVVIMVPIGVVLYQRLKPAPPDPMRKGPAARPVPPPPANAPAPPPIAVPPAAAQPAAPAPQQARPAAAPPAASAEGTRIVRKEDMAPPAPAATEMVKWYGMLHCTSGPLEGQRFIIEPDGFYIGRDPALSQIVIPDGRVSKRHVRIVVRDDKVHAIDQDSTNGTFLGKAGGERVADVQLKRGDKLVLADDAATFVYQI